MLFCNIIEKILSVIYPDKCVLCHKINFENKESGICDECFKKFIVFDDEICKRNFMENNGFSMFLYNSEIRDIIHKFKYNDCGHYARVMGMKMGEFFIKQNLFCPDFIIPVPIHWRRKMKRGYNQTEIMAKEISKICGIPVVNNLLIRKRNTVPQFGLNREMRIKNIEGAFAVKDSGSLEGKDVVIIDDIYTTGTTLNECIKVIKSAGVKNAYYFTLSSTESFIHK